METQEVILCENAGSSSEGCREEFVRLRAQIGSQAQVAKMLDRSLAWLAQIEQGRRTPPQYAIYALRYLLIKGREQGDEL